MTLRGHRTSLALEPAFWAALEEACGGRPLAAVVAAIDEARAPGTPLASAVRVWALERAASGATLRAPPRTPT